MLCFGRLIILLIVTTPKKGSNFGRSGAQILAQWATSLSVIRGRLVLVPLKQYLAADIQALLGVCCQCLACLVLETKAMAFLDGQVAKMAAYVVGHQMILRSHNDHGFQVL